MNYKFIDTPIKYDGTQLSSHFAYKNFNIVGNSIISFIGPVDVKLTEMVDIEDVNNKDPISSDKMLNFIIELFDIDLLGSVFVQRLFMCIIKEEIENLNKNIRIIRNGDDLYFDNRKLSVSIATASPISTMIHSALNIVNTGAPIKVSSLNELNIEPINLANTVMKRFSEEWNDSKIARMKVNWVK